MLHNVMYHFVRALPDARYPGLKGVSTERFIRQVEMLELAYEMATLESALAYLSGDYEPDRDMCLLTFDDGLKEHAEVVTPILAERGIEGVFFISTAALDHGQVFPVHMSQLLLAALGFEEYRNRFMALLAEMNPELISTPVDPEKASRAHRWDEPEVARFKYLLNACLPAKVREDITSRLFGEEFGPEENTARELYLGWEDARRMREQGMILGGHAHTHVRLADLGSKEQTKELVACRDLLGPLVEGQGALPFCYPWGKRDTYDQSIMTALAGMGFDCAFTSEPGGNQPGQAVFEIKRTDAAAVEDNLV